MSESINTLELLTHVDIFAGIPESALLALLSTAETEGHEAGEVIFEEGSRGGAMFLVAAGAVELSTAVGSRLDPRRAAAGRGGEHQRLALLDRGQIFGELSLFDELPRSAQAQAFVKTTLLRFPASSFNRLLEEQPAIAPQLLHNIVKKLSLRLRDADLEIRELSRARA